MRTFTAALAAASLLVGSAAAKAQATRATQANPFERQGTTPAAPTNPAPQPTPSQPGNTPTGASQFQSESAAKQACGADTVVWANTSGSKAWHMSGDKYYGHTKRGAYMCEQAAQQAGYHPSGGCPCATRRHPNAVTTTLRPGLSASRPAPAERDPAREGAGQGNRFGRSAKSEASFT